MFSLNTYLKLLNIRIPPNSATRNYTFFLLIMSNSNTIHRIVICRKLCYPIIITLLRRIVLNNKSTNTLNNINQAFDNIKFNLSNNQLIIFDDIFHETITIHNLVPLRKYSSNAKLTSHCPNPKILVDINLSDTLSLMVYARGYSIFYYIYASNKYKHLCNVKQKVHTLFFTKRNIYICITAYIQTLLDLKVDSFQIHLTEEIFKTVNLKTYTQTPCLKTKLIQNTHWIKFKIKDVLNINTEINNNCFISFCINGEKHTYPISNVLPKNNRNKYVPIRSIYSNNHAMHFRRNFHGHLVFIKRIMDDIEYNFFFRLFESSLFSKTLLGLSKIRNIFPHKKINIYYEKFCQKAEEGCFDLFNLASKENNFKNYYILNKSSADYSDKKKHKNVVAQYSLKYYWYIYCADNFIATEAPAHLNIIRSNNKHFRKCINSKNYFFLQHGVTYMKRHGRNSPFVRGKEAQCDYIVVGSKKEQDIVCSMLKMQPEEVLITGLPIFSKIEHKHLSNSSNDIVVIMLTWKPYEEHLHDFSQSSYYQYTLKLYNTVAKYTDKENILIVPHPKVSSLLEGTDLKENLWTQPISDVLAISKLLITDYSSVCYNSFYQGGSIIFYQEDLDTYERENGELIPKSDEYIGQRIFNIDDLNLYLTSGINNSKINLNHFRTAEHEKQYQLINSFTDGKNIDRIYDAIKNKII